MSDPINPDHYNRGGTEVIDFMAYYSSGEEFKGHLRLSAIKYLSRGPYKGNALQDYRKALWYLNKPITELELDAEDSAGE